MTRGYEILFDLDTVKDFAKALARKTTSASVDCPDAIERNAWFIREGLELIRDELAIVESKLPKPREVSHADAA